MKTSCIVSATLLAGLLTISARAESCGEFKFEAADVTRVIEVYRSMTSLELVVASNVSTASHKVTVESQGKMTAFDAARLVE